VNTAKKLPTLYIPHGGGPCFFMDPPPGFPHMWDGLASYLRSIDGTLGVRPKAVLVVSGHWETPEPTLNIAEKPDLLFDYYGFPEHTYRLKYPVSGAPALAPGGRESHPREEHLIPLMVAAGAAGEDPGVRTFSESIAGKALSGFQFG
jgi:aromatic ring-opening dioxygenase catalytic subunit (LigB family)